MARSRKLKRKSALVDERMLGRAKELLGARYDSETIRVCLERIIEMDEFWHFMHGSHGALPEGSTDRP